MKEMTRMLTGMVFLGAHRLRIFRHRASFAKGGFKGVKFGVFWAICHFSTPPPRFL